MALYSTYEAKNAPAVKRTILFDNDYATLPAPLNNIFALGERARISPIRREIKNFSANLAFGRTNISALDVGTNIATYLSASHLTAKNVSVYLWSYFLDSYKTLTGFVGNTQYDSVNGIINFEVYDRFYGLRDAFFLFDYKNMQGTYANIVYGTILNISGSNIYFHAPGTSDEDYGKYIRHTAREMSDDGYGLIGDAPPRRVQKRFPSRRDSFKHEGFDVVLNDLEYYNFFTEGQYVKFSPNEYDGYPTEIEFYKLPSFRMSRGTFITGSYLNNPLDNSDLNINFGTLEIDSIKNFKARKGDLIYIRKPLVLAGNPIEILKAIMTGTNTSLMYSIGTLTYDTDSFATAVNYYQHYNLFKEYNESSNGDVAKEISNLAKEMFFDLFIDRNGTVQVKLIKPYGNEVNTQGSFYNNQNCWNMQYNHSIEDAIYEIRGKYNSDFRNPYETDEIIITKPSIYSVFGSKALIAQREYTYITDPDEAIVNASRELFWRRRGVVRWEFTAPLFGLAQELGSYTVVKNEGIAGSHIAYIDSMEIDANEHNIRFGAWDYTNCFQNFYIGIWENSATSKTGSNEKTNGDAENTAGWDVNNDSGLSLDSGDYVEGANSIVNDNNVTSVFIGELNLAVNVGATYFVRTWTKKSAGASGAFYLGIKNDSAPRASFAGASDYATVWNGVNNTSWQEIVGTFVAQYQYTSPYVYANFDTNGKVHVDDFRFQIEQFRVGSTSESGWSRPDPAILGSKSGVLNVLGTATGSIATLIAQPNLYMATYLQRFYAFDDPGTIFWFKQMRKIAETDIGTWIYRFSRIVGDGTLTQNSLINMIGTSWDAVKDIGYPISQIVDANGEYIGGTIDNFNSDYGSSVIFW